MADRTLSPFGLRLEVESDDPRPLEAASEVARFADLGLSGELRMTIRTVADQAPDPAWPVTSVEQHEGWLIYRCGSGVLRADAAAGSATIELPESLLAIPDAVKTFVEGGLSALAIGQRRLHAVHAGMVVIDGVGLLLRGPSGAGKSTLTYAAMCAGATVVSDDWVYAAAARPPSLFAGHPWRMFLVGDTARFFPEVATIEPVAHPGADRWKLPIVPPETQQAASAVADAVVIIDGAGEPGWTEIDSATASARFTAPSLPSEQRDLPRAWLDALVARPAYVLHRGRHPAEAAAALADIAAHVAERRISVV